eukprot:2393272-Pleurochrysis_carterae.AAC.2
MLNRTRADPRRIGTVPSSHRPLARLGRAEPARGVRNAEQGGWGGSASTLPPDQHAVPELLNRWAVSRILNSSTWSLSASVTAAARSPLTCFGRDLVQSALLTTADLSKTFV